jgi:alpha-L-fucosidase
MFIHWGPVSLTGLEISWSRANSNPKCPNKGPTPIEVYDHLYQKFNPVQFDAREWVATARAAGMKYMVLTAKHCDGFLLWHSQADGYNIAKTPFQRDVCGELAKAAHDEGMRLGGTFRRWTARS